MSEQTAANIHVQFIRSMEAVLAKAAVDERGFVQTKTDQPPLYKEWQHQMAGAMLVTALGWLNSALGKRHWRTLKYEVDEFEALSCIRNAFVHFNSDLSGFPKTDCLQQVLQLESRLKQQKIRNSMDEVVEPYFILDSTRIILLTSSINRVRSLCLGLLDKAGAIDKRYPMQPKTKRRADDTTTRTDLTDPNQHFRKIMNSGG
jgi:hypothetical protein